MPEEFSISKAIGKVLNVVAPFNLGIGTNSSETPSPELPSYRPRGPTRPNVKGASIQKRFGFKGASPDTPVPSRGVIPTYAAAIPTALAAIPASVAAIPASVAAIPASVAAIPTSVAVAHACDDVIPASEGVTLGPDDVEFKATTCWIAAEHALKHVRNNISQLAEMFSRWKIEESDYAVHAGFNESLIQDGIGYLEQIHVFVSAEVTPTSDFLSELGMIFSPFSAALFTESSFYDIPVFKDDGSIWQLDELIHLKASIFLEAGPSTVVPPTVITLSDAPSPTESPSDFSQDKAETNDGIKREKKRSKKGKERDDENDDQPDKGKKDDDNPDKDPEEPSGGGNASSEPAKISFDIVSKIYSIGEQLNRHVFQTLTMAGTLSVQSTPLDPQYPDKFPTCSTQFTELTFGTRRTTGSLAYGQFHLRITVDPQHRNAAPASVKPKRTTAFEREAKESSSTKTGQTVSGSISAAFGLTTQATITGGASRVNEVGTSSERKRYMSRITQQTMYGVVWWGFNIEDPYEREGGIDMSDAALPSVNFKFLGNSEVPDPPPKHIDFEIASYWSITAGIGKENGWIRTVISMLSRTGSYSNLCQIVTLTVPSMLAKGSDYRATLNVHPGQSPNSSNHRTEVSRQTGSVEVTPAVLWGDWDPASLESEDLRKISILKLPTLTRVTLPDHYAIILEDSSRSSKSH